MRQSDIDTNHAVSESRARASESIGEWDGEYEDRVIVALADERDRLRAHDEAAMRKIAFLSDELDRLRAERAEVLALLEDESLHTTDYCGEDADDELADECPDQEAGATRPCLAHRLAAMVARLKGEP